MNFPKIQGKLVLAPMAGYSDVAFRVLCRRLGAGMCFTEMISAEAVVRGQVDVELVKEERPVALQLFGDNPLTFVKAAKSFSGKLDMIDINMGCPSTRIRKGGSGSKLLEDKERIRNIVRKLVEEVNVPVSVKVRKCKEILEIAKIVEEEGGSAIIVHGRTFGQGYSGRADWKVIKKVKDAVGDKVVVVGSGDVCSVADAERMMKETGCDYAMIGREALRNPYVFCNEKVKDLKKLFLDYSKLAEKYGVDVKEVKAHSLLFTKGMIEGGKLREKLNTCKNRKEIEELFSNL